ncbi:dTMP kinase [Streptomyces sp. NPDC048479]|uniref:dTMP kinase n=1 Tax=Streptomyces sp. NPDC048479 TaxID=3154725 RepID=UPI003448F1DC
MTRERGGCFVSIDGPSGIGKSTTVKALHRELAARGIPSRLTVEPTRSDLGQFTRQHADRIHGRALACLVAATRYEHIEQVIQPALRAGDLLISDRYMPSTLVLQHLDGVPLQFLLDINRDVLMPDLAVILTAQPGLIAERLAARGITHRFHLDPTAPSREVELYAQAAAHLMSRGVEVLCLDTSEATPSEVVSTIADAIPRLPIASVVPSDQSTPQES